MDTKDLGSGFLFSMLHWASFFRIVELVALVIEMRCDDAAVRSFLRYMPLAWALYFGSTKSLENCPGREISIPMKQIIAAEYGSCMLLIMDTRSH